MVQPGATSSPEHHAEEPGLPWPPVQNDGECQMESLLDACSPDDLRVLTSQMESMRLPVSPQGTAEANDNHQLATIESPCHANGDEQSALLKAQLKSWVSQTDGCSSASQLDQQIVELMRVQRVLGPNDLPEHTDMPKDNTGRSGLSSRPHSGGLANRDTNPSVERRGKHALSQDYIHPLFQMLLSQPRAYNPHQATSMQQAEGSPAMANAAVAADLPEFPAKSEPPGSPLATIGPFSFPKTCMPLSETLQLAAQDQGPPSPVVPVPIDESAPRRDLGNGSTPKPGNMEACQGADSPICVRSGRKRPEVDYSQLAGGRPSPHSQLAPTSKRKHRPSMAHCQDQRVSPAALAVAGVIAAGPPEGALEDQWAQLDKGMELGILEFAPDDEIIGETLSCQSELLQQITANRQATTTLLRTLLEQLPKLRHDWKEKKELGEEATGAWEAIKELKRVQQREKREARRRELHEEAVHEMVKVRSPRPSRPPRRIYDEAFKTPHLGAGRRDQSVKEEVDEGVDPLAGRRMDSDGEVEDAVCAVCGQGHSNNPSVIVFCERCDLPVHQQCYGVTDFPHGEWLCWPCKLHEEALADQGMPHREIRPSKYELSSRVDRSQHMEGGSRDTACVLCPVKLGAFKKTADGKAWVHVVCAMWHRQTWLVPEDIVQAVHGLEEIPKQRWSSKCDVCGSVEGATVKCGHPSCKASMHPLCARRAGLLLLLRPSSCAPSRPSCKVYCKAHGDAHQIRQPTSPTDGMFIAIRKDKQGHTFSKLGSALDSLCAADSEDAATERGGASVRSRDRKSGRSHKRSDLADASPSTLRPYQTPLTCESHKRALEALATMERDHEHLSQLRCNLEKVRLLADQVKRRERLKTSLSNARFERLQAVLADPSRRGNDLAGQLQGPWPSLAATVSTHAKPRGTAPKSTCSISNKKGPQKEPMSSMSEDVVSDDQTAKMELMTAQGRRRQRQSAWSPPGSLTKAGIGHGGPSTRSGSVQEGKGRRGQHLRPAGDISGVRSIRGRAGVSLATPLSHGGGNVWKKAASPGRKADPVRLPGERYLNNEELHSLNTELRPRGYAYVSVDQIRKQGRPGVKHGAGGGGKEASGWLDCIDSSLRGLEGVWGPAVGWARN
eukprot:evm.model.scf_632.5 EVM.evm.TU.scf_632.5   scf_632:53761-64479(+)